MNQDLINFYSEAIKIVDSLVRLANASEGYLLELGSPTFGAEVVLQEPKPSYPDSGKLIKRVEFRVDKEKFAIGNLQNEEGFSFLIDGHPDFNRPFSLSKREYDYWLTPEGAMYDDFGVKVKLYESLATLLDAYQQREYIKSPILKVLTRYF